MKLQDCFVSVVVPIYNDRDIIEEFVTDLSAVLSQNYTNYEMVLVDDGSTDDMLSLVNELLEKVACLRVIRLSRNFGAEIAIAAGLDTVIGDYVVIMAPNTDPPALIPEMVSKARGGAGIVVGIRKHRDEESFLERQGANLFYWYLRKIMGVRVPRNATNFQVLSRQAVNAVTLIRDRLRFVRSFIAYVGYDSVEVPYDRLNRRGTREQGSLLGGIDLAIRIIIANSTHPLRIVSGLGLLLSLLNLGYAGYVLLTYLFSSETAEGWVTQSLQISAMFFFLFLIITVICEYLGRILAEVQQRPLYYVRNELNSRVLIANEERRNVTVE